jgi:hypothetical protein
MQCPEIVLEDQQGCPGTSAGLCPKVSPFPSVSLGGLEPIPPGKSSAKETLSLGTLGLETEGPKVRSYAVGSFNPDAALGRLGSKSPQQSRKHGMQGSTGPAASQQSLQLTSSLESLWNVDQNQSEPIIESAESVGNIF